MRLGALPMHRFEAGAGAEYPRPRPGTAMWRAACVEPCASASRASSTLHESAPGVDRNSKSIQAFSGSRGGVFNNVIQRSLIGPN